MLRSPSEMLVQYRETIGDIPPRLTGATITSAGSKLYLFGGSLASATETRLLSSLYVFDLELLKWERIQPAPEDPVPTARYFHTADIWNDHLIVFGGLGAHGSDAKSEQLQALNDVRLFNMSTRRWLPPPRNPVHSLLAPIPPPRYAHLTCISSDRLVVIGGKDFWGQGFDDVYLYDLKKTEWIRRLQYSSPSIHALAATSQWHTRTPLPDAIAATSPLPPPLSYSEPVTNKSPSDIYIYNADHPQKGLEVILPLPNAEIQSKIAQAGAAKPPCLQFPSGGILGNTLILAGNYPAENKDHSFFIWTLDLATNIWSPIDTDDSLKKSFWSTGCLCHKHSKFVVFGNRAGAFVDTANRLVLGWNEVALLDLEALGIYQPPPSTLDEASQRLGLTTLADGRRADFDFICEDGRYIRCWRKLIMERWSWLHEQQMQLAGNADPGASVKHGKRTEITLTWTSCSFSQSYPVTMALLQYFYSLTLGTPLQRAPAVLSNLLLISTEFKITHLQALVTHAMHLALSEATAAGVYEIAASCGCRSLQIRAFSIHANKNRNKNRDGSEGMSRPTGGARSNLEGTRPHMSEKRFGQTDGFPSSAFTTRTLNANSKAAADTVPAVPPLPPSVLATRNSDPALRRPASREPLLSSPTMSETGTSASPANASVLVDKHRAVPPLLSSVTRKSDPALRRPASREPLLSSPTIPDTGPTSVSPADAGVLVGEHQAVPPLPSSVLATRKSDPALRSPAQREPQLSSPTISETGSSGSPANASVLVDKHRDNPSASEENRKRPDAGNIHQRKRSQSVGASRIPRPASRAEQTRPASRAEQTRPGSRTEQTRPASKAEQMPPPYKPPKATPSALRHLDKPPNAATGAAKASRPFMRERYSRPAEKLNHENSESPAGPRQQPTRGRRGEISAIPKDENERGRRSK